MFVVVLINNIMDLFNFRRNIAVVAAALLLSSEEEKTQKRKKRRYAVRPINRDRVETGFFKMYFLPMKCDDAERFYKFTRMDVHLFNKLLNLITPHIRRKVYRHSNFSNEERLAITLNYLSTGASMSSIAINFHMGHSTVQFIVKEMCTAIRKGLQDTYLVSPTTEKEWLSIAEEFSNKWQFPHCIGAIDGKHIQMQAPPKSGSLYFNYKKTFSIVLLASCDANYIFNFVDIGAYGAESDGGIFRNSTFGRKLDANELKIPAPSRLPDSEIVLPFALVGDEAFPLKEYILRPYPGKKLPAAERIFNYRLSRARRVIENAFGILANRWRLLLNCIMADVSNVDKYAMTCICLHNYLRIEKCKVYCPAGFTDCEDIPGTWREEVTPLSSVGRLSANRAKMALRKVRDDLRDYFMAEGEFPPQWKVLD